MASRKLIVEIVGDSRSLERSFARSSRATNRFGRDLTQAGRGTIAVSGLFAGLGRQVAFASGAFLGGAGFTKVLKDSITEAQEAEKTQRQLAAQFKAAGQNLSIYQAQIDRTSTRLSQLAGIQDEELTQAFTSAFRGTRDVNSALKIQAVAADVAKGRNIELSSAAIALTKAYLGQTTALKRLGVQIPKNVSGMEALDLVGRRFAGQAEAGTTSQQRLSVALAETEETIGRALLPTVEKYTNRLNKWLSNEDNQVKIQKTADKGAKALGVTIDVLSKSVELATSKWNPFVDVVIGANAAIKALQRTTSKGIPGVEGPVGTPARTGPPVGVTGPKGTPSGPLGLLARLARGDVAVAKALTTRTKADDRSSLLAQAELLRVAIASGKKAFKDKASLYRQFASVLGQVESIDEAARQLRIDAHEKAADAAKRARDKERAARKKAHDQAVAAAKDARDAAKEAARDFRDLINTERERIGELFGGPLFNPSEAQRKAALGAPTPGANVKTLVADLRAQIQQFKAFQRDLQTLAKRGAPPQLLAELRQGGLAVAPQVHALATAGAGTFAQFKSLFIQRERLAVQAAQQARPVVNLTVIVNPTTGHVSVKTTPHGQKRGRNPGVVINQGRVLP